ncbi:hypothetical protein CLV30_104178 [Haloactinopolyspora alba]|uniref:Uncharacterized protein n=1 Tax=Haloactinopolyspora alba TaxID=648780 RepID=A0A2P8E758_9ACTN|nr:hypothetical protein [Haloactinopolyspora alba]PSL05312.1 hypothetical protein CLV30_104178 [Haloactinopolyspora alba]
MTDSPTGALHAAAVCEVAWLGAGGRPGAAAAVPLVLDGVPAVALPYAYASLARLMGTATRVAVVLSDRRQAGSAWLPVVVHGRPRLVEDTDGTVFTEHLIHQELRKYPPARALADSPILRREHWWYLPRLIVTVEPDAVAEVAARQGGAVDGLLAVADSRDGLRVGSVAVGERSAGGVRVAALSEPAPGIGPAVALCHDFSAPDLERWTSWTAYGQVTGADGTELRVDAQDGTASLPPVPGLLARIRRQRQLARACRRGLAD